MSLSQIVSTKLSAAFDSNGAFFAFGTDQFNEQKKEGVIYVNLSAGLVCPKENAKQLLEQIKKIRKEGIAEDAEKNGLRRIIKRELANYECYYTGDCEPCIDALVDYDGITPELIYQVYNEEREKYD